MPSPSSQAFARLPRPSRISATSSPLASETSRMCVWANSSRKSATRSPIAHRSPGRGRNDDRIRAHQLRDGIRVQRPGATVGDEGEVARIVAALNRDEAKCACHVLVHDREDALRGLLDRGEAHRVGDLLDRRVRGVDVERHLAAEQAGRRWPRTTFASVTVGSSPPLPYAAGPGSAPADCGPTRRAFVSSGTCAIEPPPAPTVWTLTEGTLIRKCPIDVSRPIVGWPSWQRATSVEVPPMSNVRMSSIPGLRRDVECAGDPAGRA